MSSALRWAYPSGEPLGGSDTLRAGMLFGVPSTRSGRKPGLVGFQEIDLSCSSRFLSAVEPVCYRLGSVPEMAADADRRWSVAATSPRVDCLDGQVKVHGKGRSGPQWLMPEDVCLRVFHHS